MNSHIKLNGLQLLPALACAIAFPLLAQPAASLPKLEVRGEITAVNLVAGQMPSIAVKAPGGRLWTVRLGSMRYLIANDFNPKTGQSALIRGFQQDPSTLLAISVDPGDPRRKLILREEDGRPLWRGGPRKGPPPD